MIEKKNVGESNVRNNEENEASQIHYREGKNDKKHIAGLTVERTFFLYSSPSQ
jgi:hypothetical protein